MYVIEFKYRRKGTLGSLVQSMNLFVQLKYQSPKIQENVERQFEVDARDCLGVTGIFHVGVCDMHVYVC